MMELDINQIMKVLPHRFPFLLVDKIIELEAGKSAVGIKNVTINEPFFQGHFPEHPIMPGVLQIEAMAQVGAVVALLTPAGQGKLVYFASVDSVRFRKPVFPGDQLRIEVGDFKSKGQIRKMKGRILVNDAIVVEAEITCSLVDKDVSSTGASIHPTATVHASAVLGKGVIIGPYAFIGPEVSIGEGTSIGAHTVIRKWARIGKNNKIYQGVSIGADPQDVHYKGQKGEVVIGDRNVIREFVTIHLPTKENGATSIGSDNFIMVHAHIPHDCRVGNQTIIGGYLGIAGHATIDDQAVVGGMAGIHQFVRVGRLAMVGAQSKIVQDVPPFVLIDGNPSQVRGLNLIGMQRRGISNEAQTELKKAFRFLYQSGLNTRQAIDQIRKNCRPLDEVRQMLEFLEVDSPRGINRKFDLETEEEEMVLPELPELGI